MFTVSRYFAMFVPSFVNFRLSLDGEENQKDTTGVDMVHQSPLRVSITISQNILKAVSQCGTGLHIHWGHELETHQKCSQNF